MGPGGSLSCHTSQTAPGLGDRMCWLKPRTGWRWGVKGPRRITGPSLYLGAPGWTAVGHHLKDPSSTTLREPAFGGGGWGRGPGAVSPVLTAAPQCTVVERSPRICGVAPGPVTIPVWVPAEVLLQWCVWGGGGGEPMREGEQNQRVIPSPRKPPVGEPRHAALGLVPGGACGLGLGGTRRAGGLTAACAASPRTSADTGRPFGSC